MIILDDGMFHLIPVTKVMLARSNVSSQDEIVLNFAKYLDYS